MKRLLIATVSAIALLACQREQTQPTATTATTSTAARPQNLGQAKVNTVIPMAAAESMATSKIGDGKTEKNTFKSGEPIVVTITLRDNPKGVQLKTQWFDAKKKMLKEDKKELVGQNSATFAWSGKKLRPGKYRVLSFWGENAAGDHEFEVTK